MCVCARARARARACDRGAAGSRTPSPHHMSLENITRAFHTPRGGARPEGPEGGRGGGPQHVRLRPVRLAAVVLVRRRHPPARLPRPARKHFSAQARTHPPAPPPTLPPHFTPQPPPPPPAVPPLPSLASQSRVRACGCVRAGECARARPRPLVRACPCLRAWRVRVRVPVSTFAFVCTCRPPAQRRAAGDVPGRGSCRQGRGDAPAGRRRGRRGRRRRRGAARRGRRSRSPPSPPRPASAAPAPVRVRVRAFVCARASEWMLARACARRRACLGVRARAVLPRCLRASGCPRALRGRGCGPQPTRMRQR